MPLERPGKQVRRPGGWPALQCDEERLMTNESMVKITNLGGDDPALPKPNPPPPTPVPATETDPQWIITEDPPDSPQVQPQRP